MEMIFFLLLEICRFKSLEYGATIDSVAQTSVLHLDEDWSLLAPSLVPALSALAGPPGFFVFSTINFTLASQIDHWILRAE